MPTQFDPFEPRYTQQKTRERESALLPVCDDTDDDEDFDHVYMVPETQPINDEAVQLELDVEVEKVEVMQLLKNKIWMPD